MAPERPQLKTHQTPSTARLDLPKRWRKTRQIWPVANAQDWSVTCDDQNVTSTPLPHPRLPPSSQTKSATEWPVANARAHRTAHPNSSKNAILHCFKSGFFFLMHFWMQETFRGLLVFIFAAAVVLRRIFACLPFVTWGLARNAEALAKRPLVFHQLRMNWWIHDGVNRRIQQTFFFYLARN